MAPYRSGARRAERYSTALVLAATSIVLAARASTEAQAAPAFTVADSIGTESIGTVAERTLHADPAVCNPSGRRCVIVSFHGDVADDRNVFSLRLFDAAGQSMRPTPLFQIRTDSNRPGIERPKWISEDRLVFVSHSKNGSAELRTIDVVTGAARTEAATNREIVAFSASPNGETIVAALLERKKPLFADEAQRHEGRIVKGEMIEELITGRPSDLQTVAKADQLLVIRRGRRRIVPLMPDVVQIITQLDGISVSPDGRWLAVQQSRQPADEPASWQVYKMPKDFAVAMTLAVMDLDSGRWTRVVDAPGFATSSGTDLVHWSPDSMNFAYSTLLPPDLPARGLRSSRATTPYLVKFDVTTHQATILAQGFYEFQTHGLRPGAARVHRQSIFDRYWPSPSPPAGDLFLSPSNELIDQQAAEAGRQGCEIAVEQNVWTPPVVKSHCPGGGGRLLYEFAPELRRFDLARIEEVSFNDTHGKRRTAGLFIPVRATPGEPLPLVVQTHGWDPAIFTLDGESNAGYAAQALAAKGYYVVQCDCSETSGLPEEGMDGARNIDALIDSIAATHPIDTSRLAMVGWSRTGLEVRAAMVGARHKFRAAVLSDAQSDSYIEYLSSFNIPTGYDRRLEAAVGAIPVGHGLKDWIDRVSIYKFDQTSTALRLTDFGPNSLIGDWEDYFILKRLGKPVELAYLPDAAHDPIRPKERMTAQQGSVDWISKWLGQSPAAFDSGGSQRPN